MKFFRYILFVLVATLTSCAGVDSVGKSLENAISEQMRKADELTGRLALCLEQESFDSLYNITSHEDDILFYVFGNRRMVYWSHNWLSSQQVTLYQYDEWFYQHFDNAHCICYWSRAGDYNIMTVIPVKYDYAFENSELRNTFISPFRVSEKYDISYNRQEGYAVMSPSGNYMFSLVKTEEAGVKTVDNSSLAESFSYRRLSQQQYKDTQNSKTKAHKMSELQIVMLVLVIVCALIIGFGIYGLIRYRGLRNMRLRTKLLYVFVALQLLSFAYIFIISVRYVRRHYEDRQQIELKEKTKYIQKFLQDTYYWNVSLSRRNSTSLNADLRDLSFTYETDIHVYDMNGDMLGTSSPALFDNGVHSRHIAPQVIFGGNANLLQYEQIGDLRYLCAYTEFYNGNYVQIGYISVPLFISSAEVEEELNDYLTKLFPLYLVVLLLTVVLVFVISKGMTRPLDKLADMMRDFSINKRNTYLDYANKDEIGELVARYNQMVKELETSADKLARSEREGAWRTMARQIAHEINNPLTPMKLTIQQLQRVRNTEKFEEYFNRATKMLVEQIDNMSRIASSFSTFAKMPELVLTSVDVAEKLYSVISLFRNNQNSVPVRYVGPQMGVMARTDGEQISFVFNNLLKNALQAVEEVEQGDVIVMLKQFNTSETETAAGDLQSSWVEISVSDNGKGINPEIRDKIFMPNFTTKSNGMGLGLAISKNIVEGSRGTISFETSEKGTVFYVRLRQK